MLDWMVDLAAVDTRTPEKEEASRARMDALVEAWRDHDSAWDLDMKDVAHFDGALRKGTESIANGSPEQSANLQLAPAVSRAVSDIKSLHAFQVGDDRRPGWGRQTFILTRR